MLDSSPFFKMIELDEVNSTNSFLAGYRPLQPTDITLVTAEYQTAGRGQTGNSWESERSQNLLFSLLLHPNSLPAAQMFVLSEAIALSIRDALITFLDDKSSDNRPSTPEVTVKWPNDIYVGDCKIGGILIENTLRGQYIDRCIIGCGVNINQATFHSDAPNPISLRQLLGHDVERRFVLEAIIDNFNRHYSSLQSSDSTHSSDSTVAAAAIHSAYLAALYRRQGLHPYRLPSSPTPFLAEIADVQPTGHLILRDPSGTLHRFAFKEVSFDYSND